MSKGKNTESSSISSIKKMANRLGEHPNITFYMCLLVLLFLVPFCLNILLSPISSNNSPSAIWMGFWGSFLGGIISAVITYVVMIRTFKENNKNNDTERDSSIKLHRAETLRNDYRDQSKCINDFVNQIQELFSEFHVKLFSSKNPLDKIEHIVFKNAIEIKANLKKAHDAIYDIPISDKPAQTYLQKIDSVFNVLTVIIDGFTSSIKESYAFVSQMEEEDTLAEANGSNRYIETPIGLTIFNKTILSEVFDLRQDYDTGNLVIYDSNFINGWEYVNETDHDICCKQLMGDKGLFLVSSPHLTEAFFSDDNNNLSRVYRQILMKILQRLESYPHADANVKNFENSCEEFFESVSFEYLMVIPIVITRPNTQLMYSEITDKDHLCPIVMTEKIKALLKKRMNDINNFGWKISDTNSKPKCRFEIDDELRKEMFGRWKDDYLFEDEKSDNQSFDSQHTQYLDFVFGDFTHPEISIMVSNIDTVAKILSLPSILGSIHERFGLAVKEELSKLTSTTNNNDD